MILLETHSRFLLQILQNRMKSLERPVELDYHFVEFDDVRYHIQATVNDPYHMVLSILIPTPPPETVFSGGLPFGATEAVKGAYGAAVQIVDTPEEGFQLTLKLDLAKLPSDEERRTQLMTKIASLRSVVLGAPMREILKHLAFKIVAPDADRLVALVHRPKESFFLIPQPEKVTVVFPMRFKDSVDVILATSFLQEFMEARRTAGLNNAPPCVWSPSPPLELKGAPAHALHANAGFVSFAIFPRHVVGKKLERTVWSLSTFHAYVNYHIKGIYACNICNEDGINSQLEFFKIFWRMRELLFPGMQKSGSSIALGRQIDLAYLIPNVLLTQHSLASSVSRISEEWPDLRTVLIKGASAM